MTRVLVLSKPVAPPWNDGTRVLVRDLARSTTTTTVRLLTTRDSTPDWGPRVEWMPVHRRAGGHAPGLAQNARALLALVAPGAPVDVAHFFFTPNRLTCSVCAPVVRWKGLRTVHSLCSAPRSFDGLRQLLFADRVVALSRHTASQLERVGVPGVTLIRPGLDTAVLGRPAGDSFARQHGLAGRPVVLFAGDHEEGVGVGSVLAAAPRLIAAVPGVRIVFACRPKTPAAAALEQRARDVARREGFGESTLFLGQVDDMAGLLEAASVLVLPVASLHRKVDAPLVLLEAMARGVPVIVSDAGPLPEVVESGGGLCVPAGDGPALAAATIPLLRDAERRRALGDEARRTVRERFDARTSARLHEELWADLARTPA